MDDAIDYKALLKKYMQIVIEYEGRSYLDKLDDFSFHRVKLSRQEKEELYKVAKEIR